MLSGYQLQDYDLWLSYAALGEPVLFHFELTGVVNIPLEVSFLALYALFSLFAAWEPIIRSSLMSGCG